MIERLFAGICLISLALSSTASASPASWLKTKLGNLDRSICNNPKSIFCGNKPPLGTKKRRAEQEAERARRARMVRSQPVPQAQAPLPEAVDASDQLPEPQITNTPNNSAPNYQARQSPATNNTLYDAPKPQSEVLDLKWHSLKGPVATTAQPADEQFQNVPDAQGAPRDEQLSDQASGKIAERLAPGAVTVLKRRPPKMNDRAPESDDPSETADPVVTDAITPASSQPHAGQVIGTNTPNSADATPAQCLTNLAGMGVKFTVVAKGASNGACVVSNPVQLVSLRAGGADIGFPDRPVVACQFAIVFAEWVGGQNTQGKTQVPRLAQVYTGPGYQCRTRRGDGPSKISEHGLGDAIDVERIVLRDGSVLKTIDLKPRAHQSTQQPLAADSPQSKSPGNALDDLWQSACSHFTTVLGPGSDAAHGGNIHVDLKQRRGNYRICQ